MAFLDNSGDIILDAVLTDTGRYRLARGDGSFKIQKFALGDDEIDYALYDKNNASGSAYYDLEIMQTPILEAFTNNTSTMNSKIVTIVNSNLLYLPVIELNTLTDSRAQSAEGIYYVSTIKAGCNDDVKCQDLDDVVGVLNGTNPSSDDSSYIRVDQGLNTTDISYSMQLSSDLTETSYMIEMDDKLLSLVDLDGNAAQDSFIDDDQVAAYILTLSDSTYVKENTDTNDSSGTQVIAGPRGTYLEFKLQVKIDLVTSDYYYNLLSTGTTTPPGSAGPELYKFIDTNIRVTGITTGYRVDIPVRILKQQ